MPKHLSLWLLVGISACIGVLFFRVIQPFIVAIVIAIVLAVLFDPVHQALSRRIAGRDRIAAAVTTILVLLLVLLPIGVTLTLAGQQVMQLGEDAVSWLEVRSSEDVEETIDGIQQSTIGRRLQRAYLQLSADQKQQIQRSVSRLAEGVTGELYEKTRGFLSDMFTFVISLTVMLLSLYYFLADRELFLGELHQMIPLERAEEVQLMEDFQAVCRGVILGTVVAALVQASLAGIGFAVLGVPQLWILIVTTMFCAFIPFVGSTFVWICVTIYLLMQQRYGAAITLAIYGTAIVSTSDNLIRAYVIGHEAKLHPLIALVTILGAVKLMGLWGIFLGPMLAAFLYALLRIVRQRLDSEDKTAVSEAPG